MADEQNVVPDPERAAQVELMTQALVFALLTANEQPYPLAVPAARKVAEMQYDCGVRHTGEQVTEINLPGWVTERVREDAAPAAVEPDHHAEQDTDRVCEAPAPPSRIAKKFIAGVSDDGSFGVVVSG